MRIKIKELTEKFKGDKKLVLIIFLCIGLLIMLLFSEMFKEEEKSVDTDGKFTSDSYTENLENRLEELISSIDGAGKTNVMITLETGEENVFAKQTKSQREDNNEKSKETDEYEYVIIKSASSKEDGLLIEVSQPQIRGVAVVCEGAENLKVKENIISTVSSVLDIKTNKISISKMKAN